MITSLHIQNYALIERLDIEFDGGFSVITGETGAGKSILLGAIGLLLGQRADLRMIKAGAQRCIIEARFNLSQYDFADYFTSHDLDFDGEECIIRRELTATGKSRAFINDTPTPLSDLKELGDQLIDIHSQHQNLLLNREGFQLNVLDAVAKDQTLLAEYKSMYKTYIQTKETLRKEEEEYERGKEELDYIAFQHQQLKDADLAEEEEAELEQELNTLEHAEEIKSTLYQSYTMLDGEEKGAVDLLRDATRQLEGIADVYSPAQELAERLDSCYIELRDIASELSNGAEEVEYDPERLSFVNERLSLIHSLKQKFHKENVTELIDLREDLGRQLSRIEHSDTRIYELKKEIDKISHELDIKANKISEVRSKAAKVVEKEMRSRLVPLGMPNVRFEVNMGTEEGFTIHGRDKVAFMFSANKNVPLQPIAQVASGGEISRLMLSLKALISGVEKLPTIIFDEIDTGVSGHIAEQMAKIMKEMGDGQHRQVICITHLPQIAAMGSRHYRVYKTDESNSTTSHIVSLSTEERVEELARMLSGSTLTKAAIDNARALLGIA